MSRLTARFRGPQLQILQSDHQPGGGGSCSPAHGNDLERFHEFLQTVGTEAVVVPRVLVEGVTERRHDVDETTRLQTAADFMDHRLGVGGVLHHRVALHSLESVMSERQVLRVTGNIDAGQGEQIDIHIPVDTAARPADVKVPATKRRLSLEFFGVAVEKQRRAQVSIQAAGAFLGETFDGIRGHEFSRDGLSIVTEGGGESTFRGDQALKRKRAARKSTRGPALGSADTRARPALPRPAAFRLPGTLARRRRLSRCG